MLAPAIVVGSGRSVWADLRAVRPVIEAPVVFAVNYMTFLLPTIHHAVTHHGDQLAAMLALRANRRRRNEPRTFVTHASEGGPGIDRVWPQFRRQYRGSSSLLAVQIALALGHREVIVVGVPLDNRGYVWEEPTDIIPTDYAPYRRGWQQAAGEFAGRVTAVSGYLADLLGRPAALRVEVAA